MILEVSPVFEICLSRRQSFIGSYSNSTRINDRYLSDQRVIVFDPFKMLRNLS